VKDFRGRVAVITGAASGIGRALALRLVPEGTRIVLADIEREPLRETEAELRAAGADVAAIVADVANAEDVERMAREALDRFGAVHLLFNNAGVGLIGPTVSECTRADWEWVLGVNLRGVAHGLRVFLPIMIEQATECHVVNTASAAALVHGPGMGVYNASKAGVVAISETLHHELALNRSAVRVSVLCPGYVRTRMVDAARNRPAALQNDPDLEDTRHTKYAADEQEVREAVQAAMSPDEVAEVVIDAIRHDQFYIFTHPWVKEALQLRTQNILGQRDPWAGSGYKEPDH